MNMKETIKTTMLTAFVGLSALYGANAYASMLGVGGGGLDEPGGGGGAFVPDQPAGSGGGGNPGGGGVDTPGGTVITGSSNPEGSPGSLPAPSTKVYGPLPGPSRPRFEWPSNNHWKPSDRPTDYICYIPNDSTAVVCNGDLLVPFLPLEYGCSYIVHFYEGNPPTAVITTVVDGVVVHLFAPRDLPLAGLPESAANDPDVCP